jgi:hypothetical protein
LLNHVHCMTPPYNNRERERERERENACEVRGGEV